MNKLSSTLLALFMISHVWGQIVIDNFNDPEMKDGWIESATELEIVDSSLQVTCDNVGGQGKYHLFFTEFNQLDMHKFQTISIKIRLTDTVNIPDLRFEVRDNNGYDGNENPIVFKPEKSLDYVTYSLDFTDRFMCIWPTYALLNADAIIRFTVYINVNSRSPYTGTFYLDDIILEGAQDPNLLIHNDIWQYSGSETTDWNTKTFDASSWQTTTGDPAFNTNAESTIDSSITGANNLNELFLRREFFISDTSSFKSIYLKASCDDAFIAYINGNEIAEYTLENDSYSINDSIKKFIFPLSVVDSGRNVLAIKITQTDDGENDMFLSASLQGSRYEKGISRGPYLQNASDTSIVVRWRTLEPSQTIIKYGTDVNNLTTFPSTNHYDTEHSILLKNLLPNTKYFYVIETTEGQIYSDSSYYFRTNPPVGSIGEYNFWAIGDAGRTTEGQRNTMTQYNKFLDGKHCNAWLLLGDNAYEEGTDDQYQRAMFENMFEDMMRNTPIFPTPGNHDLRKYGKYLTGIDEAPYFDIFDMPSKGECGGVPSGTESYFSWNYGNVHFISLDSYGTSNEVDGEMYKWLEEDLKADTAKWTIVYCHHSPYTKGSHDSDDPDDSHGILVELRERFVPLLESNGVDMFVTAHSHNYERSYMSHGFYGYSHELTHDDHIFYPQSSGKQSEGAPYRKNDKDPVFQGAGTIYTVIGCSGYPSDDCEWDHDPNNYITRDFMHLSTRKYTGSLGIRIHGDTLTGYFIDNKGGHRDEFSIIKDTTIAMKYARGVGARYTQKPTFSLSPSGDSILVSWETDIPAETVFLMSEQFLEFELVYRDSVLKTNHSFSVPLPKEEFSKLYYAVNYNEHKHIVKPSSRDYVTMRKLVSVTEKAQTGSMYIKPTTNNGDMILSVNLTNPQNISVDLFSVDGKYLGSTVENYSGISGINDIKLSLDIPKGKYILKSKINSKVETTSFIIE